MIVRKQKHTKAEVKVHNNESSSDEKQNYTDE